ncbi:MAG: nitrate/nitrite transporter NrtS [Chthoniobacterales bacterium]
MTLKTFILAAAHPATAFRAGLTALVVGIILTIINHGPALLAGDLTSGRLCQILLTFTVPYTVSTISSVATRHEMNSAQAGSSESVLSSMPDAA